jgi:hypothetical protein
MMEITPSLIMFHDSEFWPYIHKIRCYPLAYHRPPPVDHMIWWDKHTMPDCQGKPWELMHERSSGRTVLLFLIRPHMVMMVGAVDRVVTKGGVSLSSFEEIKSFLTE